ncbi:MAG: hypothetical protein UZ16_OP3001000537 [Candidatus Hinthialibacteria bacterium OLB16]|nr:MAG: hypothetical protein UZ16_OP3001000537 [Candidatus Hinthialibacteria bacterium OLB16]
MTHQDSLAKNLFGFGQLDTCVDADGFSMIIRDDRFGTVPLLHQNPDTVSQVIFILDILRGDLVQCLKKRSGIETIGAGVDFTDGAFVTVGILFLDNSLQPVVFISENSPIPARSGISVVRMVTAAS